MTNALARMLQRLRELSGNAAKVLSMNQRNLEYIYPNNRRMHYPIADNKLLTKELLIKAGVNVPQTFIVYSYFYELRNLDEDLALHSEFVIKPAKGSGGGGIIVIVGKDGDQWISVGGTRYSAQELRRQIGDIIFGIHSFGLSDQAIVEQRIKQHPAIERLSAGGLADVRIILYNEVVIMSMIRLPTSISGGRANLHQGAVGAGIDLKSGTTTGASLKGAPTTHHPDIGCDLIGVGIPFWNEVLEAGMKAAKAIPLKYIGVDVAISVNGPVILEINVRPGIEIQNVSQRGMRDILQASEMTR